MVLWFMIFVWFGLKKRQIRTNIHTYPLFRPMFVVLASYIVVTLFANNFSASINPLLSFLVETIFLSVMIWASYNQIHHVTFALRGLVIIFVLLAIYGTAAYLVGSNPVIEFLEANFSTDEKTQGISYLDSDRLGLVGRAQSIFPHSIQYGGLLVMAMGLTYSIHETSPTRSSRYVNLLFLLILLAASTYTNSRTPMLMILVGFASYFAVSSSNTKLKLLTLMPLLMFFALPFLNLATLELMAATFYETMGLDIHIRGSSVEMRIEQLKSATSLFWEAPFFGHGLSTTRFMLEDGELPPELRRAESFLFFLMIDGGVVAVAAYCYFFLYLIRHFFRQNRIRSESDHLSAVVLALIISYVSFILATGLLDTFRFFVVIITLLARYVFLNRLTPVASEGLFNPAK
jgi:hypothetical protein